MKIRRRDQPASSPQSRMGALLNVTQCRKNRPARRDVGIATTVLLLLFSLSKWRKSLRNSHVKHLNREHRVVVCLSTIPSRIHLLQPTLDSLILQQTEPPDMVYLTLPKKRKPNLDMHYKVPSYMESYQRMGLLQILTPEWDYGPISKVFFVLQKEPAETHIIYVDDDWIYPPNLVTGLSNKSLQYPDHAVAWSGAVLRDYFRQIGHTELHRNHHPILFMQMSDTPSFFGEEAIDLAQGFCGVLVKPRFFNLPELESLLQSDDLPLGVFKSDDFILSAHLAQQNITIKLVHGGTVPQLNEESSSIDKLSLYMYNNAMEAAYYLQGKLHVWNNYRFLNLSQLTEKEQDAIHCENGRGHCFDSWQSVLQELDERFPPSTNTAKR